MWEAEETKRLSSVGALQCGGAEETKRLSSVGALQCGGGHKTSEEEGNVVDKKVRKSYEQQDWLNN